MFRGENDVNKLIENILPDNRPITSLQIVEHYQKCPRNFTAITRTYDQDSDAELWRAKILFGKLTTRYLCLSKTEGLPNYIVETIRILSEKELTPAGYSLLSRTADTDQKAWRKEQIAYKLSKRSNCQQAVTDIIISRNSAPAGFKCAGLLSGLLIYYKLGPVVHRSPPDVPVNQTAQRLEDLMYYVNISKQPALPPKNESHDYEQISPSYKIASPKRVAPKPPNVALVTKDGTLGAHTEIDGVPFILNGSLTQADSFQMPRLQNVPNVNDIVQYDFHLERQVLCTMTSQRSVSKNPFFNKMF